MLPIRFSVIFMHATRCTLPWPARLAWSFWYLHDLFIHIPIEMLVREKKQIDPDSLWWTAVLAATGQAVRFE
jgi:hypothetical protein